MYAELYFLTIIPTPSYRLAVTATTTKIIIQLTMTCNDTLFYVDSIGNVHTF